MQHQHGRSILQGGSDVDGVWWADSENGVELFRPMSQPAKASVCTRLPHRSSTLIPGVAAAKTEGSVKTCAGWCKADLQYNGVRKRHCFQRELQNCFELAETVVLHTLDVSPPH